MEAKKEVIEEKNEHWLSGYWWPTRSSLAWVMRLETQPEWVKERILGGQKDSQVQMFFDEVKWTNGMVLERVQVSGKIFVCFICSKL
jgi:hypothetical protein